VLNKTPLLSRCGRISFFNSSHGNREKEKETSMEYINKQGCFPSAPSCCGCETGTVPRHFPVIFVRLLFKKMSSLLATWFQSGCSNSADCIVVATTGSVSLAMCQTCFTQLEQMYPLASTRKRSLTCSAKGFSCGAVVDGTLPNICPSCGGKHFPFSGI